MTLSFVLALVGITGQFVMTRNRAAGWWISLSATPLWVAFTLHTGQYGLFLMNGGYAAAAVANLWKIRRENRRVKDALGDTEGIGGYRGSRTPTIMAVGVGSGSGAASTTTQKHPAQQRMNTITNAARASINNPPDMPRNCSPGLLWGDGCCGGGGPYGGRGG